MQIGLLLKDVQNTAASAHHPAFSIVVNQGTLNFIVEEISITTKGKIRNDGKNKCGIIRKFLH